MQEKAYFHLDCLPIIAECRFQCEKCVSEICSVLEAKDGVSEAALTELDYISAISVEYDAEIIGIDEIKKELSRLPSFYADKFTPELIN
jgi:hypothetical protein